MHPTKPKTCKQKQSFWSPTNIALVTVVALWTLVHLSSGNIYVTTTISKEPRYVAVIDAGSSGSQIYIYKYSFTPYGYLKFEPDPATFKSTISLASFNSPNTELAIDNPRNAGASLEPLLEFAKAHVPANLTESTPILLKATSDLRQLQQNNRRIALSILQSVRTTLANSEFRFRPSYAEIMTGEEEGALGWLALNYLHEMKNGRIRYRGASPQHTFWSALNMGGRSSQLTIPLNDTTGIPYEYFAPHSFDRLLGNAINLFTQSFDGFGVVDAKVTVGNAIPYTKFTKKQHGHDAYKNEYTGDEDESDGDGGALYKRTDYSYRKEYRNRKTSYTDKWGATVSYHPCYPSGYRETASGSWNLPGYPYTQSHSYQGNWKGIGRFEECQDALEQLDNTAKQMGRISFWKRIKGPDLNNINRNKLWAFGIYYNIMSAVGEIATGEGAREFAVADFERIAKEICRKPWKEIDRNYPKDTQPREYNSDLCFSALYAHSFLTLGLGFEPHQRITIGNKIESIVIHWTLGAVLQHVSDERK